MRLFRDQSEEYNEWKKVHDIGRSYFSIPGVVKHNPFRDWGIARMEYQVGIALQGKVPSNIVSLVLDEVRDDIGELDKAFKNVELTKVLEVVKIGEYRVRSLPAILDLSEAKKVIVKYGLKKI